MIVVYVESNFPLEFARQQDEAGMVERIIHLAGAGIIRLVMPAISLYEPFSALGYLGVERSRLQQTFAPQLRELGRSSLTQTLAGQLRPLIDSLVQIQRSEVGHLESVITQLLKHARLVNLTLPIFAEAYRIEQQLSFSPQDAMVLATILTDVAVLDPAMKKCFVSKNRKDFDNPIVKASLSAHNCKYISNFKATVSLIEHETGQTE